MLTWRVKKKEKSLTILFFPNGTIQCVGNSSDEALQDVHSDLSLVLQSVPSSWEVKSMTVLCILKSSCDFRNLHSNKNVTYEIELFPAVQMSFWQSIHVHVFHNGKLVITGIRNLCSIPKIVNEVFTYLNLNMKTDA